MPSATAHLIALHPTTTPATFITTQPPYIIKDRPYGWIHTPTTQHKSQLTTPTWDLFLLTASASFPSGLNPSLSSHISVTIDIPKDQHATLLSQIDQRPTPAENTPPLPTEWQEETGPSPYGRIPAHAVFAPLDQETSPGELRLDARMASFLSTALPPSIRDSPFCGFNLLKYRDGSRSVHDNYMVGFKANLGPRSGGTVRYMGAVEKYEIRGEDGGERWDDSALVQYDSVWHFAYMLSTDVYRGLDEEKVRGVEDTGILLISEVGV